MVLTFQNANPAYTAPPSAATNYGRSNTRLFHRFQNHIDGSAALKSRRAFLIGQAAKSPVDLTRDGEAFVDSDADHVTFYRISIPVQER